MLDWLNQYRAVAEKELSMPAKAKPKKVPKPRRKKGQILDGLDQEAVEWELKKRAVDMLAEMYDSAECQNRAKAALKENISPDDVASSTGLSLDEVKALADELKLCH